MISQEHLKTDAQLTDLKQVAIAAGHGDGHVFTNHNAGWVQVELPNNVRPGYDINFIKTFNPDFVESLLNEILELRAQVKKDYAMLQEIHKTLGKIDVDLIVEKLS